MILSVKDVSFSYKRNQVFKQANLQIDKQGIYGLIAPNGAGKTTLLQMIVNLYSPQSGSITVLNSDKPNTKEVSFVQDNSILYPYLSGNDHLIFICRRHQIPKDEIKRLSVILGMKDYLKDKVETYSLGMKQRLLLAMGLIKKPKILLLDEPLNGLDPTSTILMRETLLEVAGRGATILVSSHNLAEMDRLTDNVFFIKDKQILSEQLSKMKEEKLQITIADKYCQRAESLLKDQTISFDRENNVFTFPLNHISVHQVLKLLIDHNIHIEHVETIYVGAEMRYRTLFEKEFSYD